MDNINEIAKLLGVKAEPMTFLEANEGKANADLRRGEAFENNCQSCVLVHEARLRGLDITALGWDKNNTFQIQLADDQSLAWRKEDGSRPFVSVKVKKEDLTDADLTKWIDVETKNKGRYHVAFNLDGTNKNKDSHILTVERFSDKDLLIYDPQDSTSPSFTDFTHIASVEVLRVDKLLIDKEALLSVFRIYE